MTTIRNYHFDNVKALLIFLVVFGHIIEPLRDIPLFKSTYFIIYSFHMPLFIFISGYFARANTNGLKKLTILFIKYEIIYAIIYSILFATSGIDTSGDLNILSTIEYILQPIWVLWFLLSLICWRILLVVYEKYPKAIVMMIAIIIGFNFIPFNFRILSLGRTLTFFPYFLIGYLVKKHKIDYHNIYHNKILFFFSIMIFCFWTLFSFNFNAELLYGATSIFNHDHSPLIVLLFKINTYIVATATSIVILNLVPRRETAFSEIGPKTLPIFLWHPIFIWLLMKVNFFESIHKFPDLVTFIILLILSVSITFFLKNQKV